MLGMPPRTPTTRTDRPSSLTAVTAKANRVEAGKDPSEWLPPTLTCHCAYETVPVDTK